MAVLMDQVLNQGEAVAFEVPAGALLRISQVEGMQVADLVSFVKNTARERLSMYMSRAINNTWKLTKHHNLVSTDGRDLWVIVDDTVGENYSGGGYCNSFVNERRYGRGDAPNCEDNLVNALAPFGYTRDSFDADTCLNVFMSVEYRPDTRWVIIEPNCHSDDHLDLRSTADQIVGLSNCPQVLNPANGFSLKRLRVEVEL